MAGEGGDHSQRTYAELEIVGAGWLAGRGGLGEGGSRDEAVGAPERDGDDGVVVRFPDGGGPLGGEGPEDDPAVAVAGEQARVGAEEGHGVDLGVVAAEDVDWLGGGSGGGSGFGARGGSGWWGHWGRGGGRAWGCLFLSLVRLSALGKLVRRTVEFDGTLCITDIGHRKMRTADAIRTHCAWSRKNVQKYLILVIESSTYLDLLIDHYWTFFVVVSTVVQGLL